MSPEQATMIEMQRFFEEQRAFDLERRRFLIAEVGAIERRWGVESVCRTCAGCENCERLHRHQDMVQSTLRASGRQIGRSSSN